MPPPDARALLLAWTALWLSCAGIGALVRRAWRAPAAVDAGAWIVTAWLGWAATVVLLEAWHLVLPVDGRATATFAALGAAGVLAAGAAPWRAAVLAIRRRPVVPLAIAAVALWLANQCLGGPRNGDSGFYHMPTIRWAATYPAVPGIANLFPALAYNQSFFLWAAALDVGPFLHRSHHVANGLLVLLLSARVVVGIARAVGRGACAPAELFHALVLPGVVGLALDLNLTSPSADVAVFALEIVVAGVLLVVLTRPERAAAGVPALALLVTAGVTVKLSVAGWTAALVMALPAARSWRTAVRAAIVAAIVAVPWIAHGVVLSGYPLYPAVIGAMPVDWRAPLAATVAEADLIRYWNGVPGWWRAALRDPHWFAGWLRTQGWAEWDVLVPLAVAVVAGVVAVVRRSVRRDEPRAVPARVVVPTLAALGFCFAAAPRARYGAAGFTILAAQSVLLAVDVPSARTRRALVAVAVALAAAQLIVHRPLWRGLREFEPYSRPDLHEVALPTGLRVWVPGSTLCCWDGPLPCTPYPNRALRLRHAGDLRAGFAIDASITPGPP